MRTASSGFFLLFARFEEKDADLIAIDPGQLAAPVCFSHSRKQQEKLLQRKPSIEPSTVSLAPVSDTSSMVQGRRQVPSIAIMLAANPRLNYNTMGLPIFHLKQSSKLNNEGDWETRRVCRRIFLTHAILSRRTLGGAINSNIAVKG